MILQTVYVWNFALYNFFEGVRSLGDGGGVVVLGVVQGGPDRAGFCGYLQKGGPSYGGYARRLARESPFFLPARSAGEGALHPNGWGKL